MRDRLCRALITLLCVLIVLPLCGQSRDYGAPVPVSIIQLIATPERFEGKLVLVFGFLTTGGEWDALYIHEEDRTHALLANGLWVESSREMIAERSKLNNNYVKMIGVFRAGHEGRDYFKAGGLTDIKQCKLWSDVEHPISDQLRKRNEK